MARPRYEPTPDQRRQVEMMAGIGVPHTDIALIIDIAPKTLREHFRAELDKGMAIANMRVASNLYRLATGDSKQALGAAIFWLKARAGWSEFSPGPPQQEQLGKKAQADLDAQSAHQGTGWSQLVN